MSACLARLDEMILSQILLKKKALLQSEEELEIFPTCGHFFFIIFLTENWFFSLRL